MEIRGALRSEWTKKYLLPVLKALDNANNCAETEGELARCNDLIEVLERVEVDETL